MSDWTLLIDFGTSFTRAAIVDAGGRTELIEVDGGPAMPSGVWAEAGGKLVAGLAAQQHAKLAPERWDRAPGRLLGLAEPLRLGARTVDPVAAVAEVLRRFVAEAVRRRKSRPSAVRLTCSPRWDATRRDALLAAARLAGLGSPPLDGPPDLVEYPVAAALQLARLGRFEVGAKIALLNLGGGSAEIAVLESTADGVLVRALGGIEGVGGEQFDDQLYRKMVLHKLRGLDAELSGRVWEPPDAQWWRAGEDLFREVHRAKEELSQQRSVTLDAGPLIGTSLQLSRVELEAVLRPQILRSARELASTIELAGLRARQLDGILITGGSARIPLVARAIVDVIGVQPVLLDEPDLFLGAAAWTPQSRVLGRAPMTLAAGQTREQADADAAAAAAALAATGSIDLSALAAPRPAFPAMPETSGGVARRAGASAWRRRWPLIVGVAVVLVVVGLVLNGPASGDDDSQPAPPTPTPTATATAVITPDESSSGSAGYRVGLGEADLAVAVGLSAQVKTISIVLNWEPVPDAAGYLVFRDADTAGQAVRKVSAPSFTDRPGDGSPHLYSVAALDADERSGPRGPGVTAEAEAPYGAVQAIASGWTAVVPVSPGKKGTSGQTCQGSDADREHSTGRISCRYSNGVQLVIMRYADPADRDERQDELDARSGVSKTSWTAAQTGGVRLSGRLLMPKAKAKATPWRWWTYDAASTYAIYAEWPKHSAKQLSSWWKQKAPFRT